MTSFAGFDWDDGNRDKCTRHGVSLVQIEAFFAGSPRIFPDLKHSASEARYLAVGRDTSGRAMFVVFAVRVHDDQSLIRPISARYMHRKEIEGYEKEEGAGIQD